MMPRQLGPIALIVMLVAVGLFFLFQQFPGAIGTEGEQIRLVQGLLVLTLVGGSFLMGWNESVGLAIKQALIWVGLLTIILTVYAYRFEFMQMGFRTAGVTMPTVPMMAPPSATPGNKLPQGNVHLSAVHGGHFLADASVNGTHVRFLVDTGASEIVLSAFDAQRLQFDLTKLNFNIPANTANGINYGAAVMLDEISIGSISRRNIRAVVMREGLEQSLLGMTFLKSISSFEMGDDVLILRD